MPPRNPELPEGTDHIVNGAMETNAGTNASTGSSGGSGGTTGGLAGGATGSTGGSTTGGATGTGGGSSSGFIGGGASGLGDGTGGTTAGGGGNFGSGGGGSGGGGNFGPGGSSGGSGEGGRAVDQVKGGAQKLRSQATGKVREYAEDGKSRATTALSDFSNVIRDSADSIDEKLGSEYGQYARRAADAVSDFSQNIDQKSVDELYDDAREVVRKSPAVAIGVAAAVGFALVRLVKAGIPDEERDVEFQPDPNFGAGGSTARSGTGPSGTNPSRAPNVTSTTGV